MSGDAGQARADARRARAFVSAPLPGDAVGRLAALADVVVGDRAGIRDDVILAPHIGSADTPTREAMARIAIDNVIAVLAGEPPLTPVSV